MQLKEKNGGPAHQKPAVRSLIVTAVTPDVALQVQAHPQPAWSSPFKVHQGYLRTWLTQAKPSICSTSQLFPMSVTTMVRSQARQSPPHGCFEVLPLFRRVPVLSLFELSAPISLFLNIVTGETGAPFGILKSLSLVKEFRNHPKGKHKESFTRA